jgi:uncharacterized membrane protein
MNYSSRLYWLFLAVSAFVVIVAAGPGLFGETTFGAWIISWQKQAFHLLCHQLPERSFAIGGVPMAVCSRCFGIYTAAFLMFGMLPWIGQSNFRNKWAILFIIVAFGANILNYGLDTLGIWENTTTSRFLMGSLIGFSAINIIGTDKPQSIKEIM